MSKTINTEVQELEDQIRRYRDQYYNDSESDIEDEKFDQLVDKLRDLDPESLALKEIGATPKTTNIVSHLIPMGSLNKINTEEEFIAWMVKRDNPELIIQAKGDGCSAVVEYSSEGKLLHMASRGNGKVGEKVSSLVPKNMDLPHNVRLPKEFQEKSFSVRGEVMILKPVFEREFSRYYANPRNLASGIFRRLDGSDAQHLSFRIFDIAVDGVDVCDEITKHTLLEHLETEFGFKMIRTIIARSQLDALNTYRNWIKNERDEYEFEVDGLVLKMFGEKAHKFPYDGLYPTHQVAWKFPNQGTTSIVRDIHWSTGSTGRVNPVVKIEPVKLAGATITNITANNIGFLEALNVSIDAEIFLTRRNDVIPAIEKTVTPGKGMLGDYATCKSCGSKTIREGSFIRCPNGNCPAVVNSCFGTWVSMCDWKGLGPKSVRKLIRSGIVKEPADFYKLNIDDMIKSGIGSANGTKILDEIKEKDTLKLEAIFAGMSMPGVGTGTFQAMIKAGYDTPDKILDISREELYKVPGIGDTRATDILNGLALRKNMILEVIKYVKIFKQEIKSSKLAGKCFEITGTLSQPRKYFNELIKQNAGQIGWDKTKENFLVTDDPNSGSSKNKAADSKGYLKITEDQLSDMIK